MNKLPIQLTPDDPSLRRYERLIYEGISKSMYCGKSSFGFGSDLGKKLFKMDPLPPGALPVYDKAVLKKEIIPNEENSPENTTR